MIAERNRKKNSDSGQKRKSAKSQPKSRTHSVSSNNRRKSQKSTQKTSSSIQKTSPSIQKSKSTSKGGMRRANRSRMSERSRESAQKSVKASPKGSLSPPPKSRSFQNKARDIDTTQWEFSRYKEEAVGATESEDPNVYVTDKVGEATPLLAEEKQRMLIRGEHLLRKPKMLLIMAGAELAVILIILLTWSVYTYANEFMPTVICFANVIVVLVVVLIVLVIQYTRLNVVKEELNEDHRFRIPYNWKYLICMLHLLRFFLSCANITVGCLDNDFDGGVIFMIAGTPLLLILSGAQIVLAVAKHRV